MRLTDLEQSLARQLAEGRASVSRGAGIKSRKVDTNRTDAEIDLQGAGAELAFCKMFNVYPDLDTHSYAEFDCVTRTGLLTDIKSTTNPNGRLLAPPWKSKNKAEVYVLMIGEFPEYRCAGFIEASKLFDQAFRTQIHSKPVQAAPQKDLSGADALEDLFNIL